MNGQFGFQSTCELIGGLALFLYGMKLASSGLRTVAGHRLKSVLGLITGNRIFGAIAGVFVTVMIQSSSATTVMLVGLADAGMMSLAQSMGVILGADIGTTVTVWFIAFELAHYALLAIAVGVVIDLTAKYRQRRALGHLLMGFGLVFYGMYVMKLGVTPLKEYPRFVSALQAMVETPIYGVLFAALFTAIVQSSGATIAITFVLASQNAGVGPEFIPLMPLKTAVPIILGANVGTCATALIASLPAGYKGKRVGVAHLFFKLAGVAIFLPFVVPFASFVSGATEWLWGILHISTDMAPHYARRLIANAHFSFNVINTLMFLPFIPMLARVMERRIRGKKGPEAVSSRLEMKVLDQPELAIERAEEETKRTFSTVVDMFRTARNVLEEYSPRKIEQIQLHDDKVDLLCDGLTEYLTRLSHRKLSRTMAQRKDMLLYIVRDLEYIGDTISKDMASLLNKLIDSGSTLSIEGGRALRQYWSEVEADMVTVQVAVETGNLEAAKPVLQHEAAGAGTRRKLHAGHLERLRKGVRESIETSAVFMDLVVALHQVHGFLADIVRVLAGETEEDA